METKQFPEKWAVRADGKDLTEELSRFNEDDKWVLNNKDVKGITYFLYDGSYLDWGDKLSDGYTEVTLEDLIAHYEPKKMVRCNAPTRPYFTRGRNYEVVNDKMENYYILINDVGQKVIVDDLEFSSIESIEATEPTHPKWMPLTRGGYEYKIYEEVGELLFGSLKMINGTYMPTTWKLNGRWGSQEYDLIPYNPRIAELEEKIESKRSELAELEGELKELKK